MMRIYSFPTFNLTKLLFTAEELQLPYELYLLDVMKGDHKKPEHLARHPLGKVPAVEINGQHYFESNSICRLMAELKGNQMYGNTPEERAQVNAWVDLFGYHIGRWLTVYFFEELVKPLLMKQQPDAAALKEAADFLNQQVPALDKALGQHAFIAGKEITIADTIGYSLMTMQDVTSVDLKAYGNVQRWYKEMSVRPAYARAMAKMPGGNMYAGFRK